MERPLESKLKRLGGGLGEKNKFVKGNARAAALNEPINFRERMIMAISEIGHLSLFPLTIMLIEIISD